MRSTAVHWKPTTKDPKRKVSTQRSVAETANKELQRDQGKYSRNVWSENTRDGEIIRQWIRPDRDAVWRGGQSPRLEHLQKIPVVPQVLISHVGRTLVDICKRVRSGRAAKLRQTLQTRNLCKIRYTSKQMKLIIHPRREPERATNKYLKTETNETERNDEGD